MPILLNTWGEHRKLLKQTSPLFWLFLPLEQNTHLHKSYFLGTVNSNQSANYSSKLISLELFTVKARIRSSPMKQHYAVITLFPFLSHSAPESLSGPVCIISSQLTVYQKLHWAYNVIYCMWCTVQFLLFANACAGLCMSASSYWGEEGRRTLADGPVLGLSNQQADKQPRPFTFEKREAVISTVRGDRGAADGMVQLAFSCRTLWTAHGCFFKEGGCENWGQLKRRYEKTSIYVDITFVGKNASINHMENNWLIYFSIQIEC